VKGCGTESQAACFLQGMIIVICKEYTRQGITVVLNIVSHRLTLVNVGVRTTT